MITIQCDGGDVEVKKSLLTAVSDVFKAMLEADMLEKRTNVVVANDVHFGTMKTIMDSYKEGTVSGFETRNRDAFVYIVEKYNFLGINEKIAEYLFESYFTKRDLTILESIFFTYGNQFDKKFVIKEMALMIAEGKAAPEFVTNFNAPDFIEFAKCCCAALKNSRFSRHQGFLRRLYSWLSKDSEKRSVVVLEIVGMIDMQQFSFVVLEIIGMIDVGKFSRQDVASLLENLTIAPKFQGLKLLLQKYLKYIDEISK